MLNLSVVLIEFISALFGFTKDRLAQVMDYVNLFQCLEV